MRVAAPPPERVPKPIFHTLPAGAPIMRLFNPARHNATPLSFRTYGPLLRFDHQREKGQEPGEDSERGIYYAGLTLSSCLVEVFGDTGVIEPGGYRLASPLPTRDLRLLDLRGRGAMRAGTNATIAKAADRRLTQAWSRYFYEHTDVYAEVDGLIYLGAHNDEEVIALYERAADALECPPERVADLNDRALRPVILDAAARNGLIMPYREERT